MGRRSGTRWSAQLVQVAAVAAALAPALLAQGEAAGQTLMDANKAETTRYEGTVAIWYGSHFEDTAMHDWAPIKAWNGPYHPMLGEYKTSDRKVLRQHLQWLRRAGVDVICYDACRIQPELTLLGLPRQKTLQLLIDELSHQEKETRKLKLVVWLEKWNSNPTPEEYSFAFDYIRRNLAQRDCYYRLDGKPLVMTYHNGAAPDLAEIDRRNEREFSIRHISPTPGDPGWAYIGPAGDKECMTAGPGFDSYLEGAFMTTHLDRKPVDTKALREHGKEVVAARAEGATFERQLLQARQVDPKIIFISGWNDWACCMQIEPAKEYGFKYVDMAARLLGREPETRPYR